MANCKQRKIGLEAKGGENIMAFIKNIEHEEIVRLADEISANTGQVVSKTLAQNSCVSITLFAFAKGEEI